jgi:hypothetical protein
MFQIIWGHLGCDQTKQGRDSRYRITTGAGFQSLSEFAKKRHRGRNRLERMRSGIQPNVKNDVSEKSCNAGSHLFIGASLQ